MKFFILGIFIIMTIAVISDANADDPHGVVIEKSSTNNYYTSEGVASAIAAGQHHYKATKQLQWSIGGGYIDDYSAVSFGLGLQVGKVFVSGNLGSDGVIGVGASGTF